MRRHRAVMVLAGAAVVWCAAASAAIAAPASSWHTAIEVPGSAGLNKGGGANIYSVSCASAGNCAAGGFYTLAGGDTEALVAGEANGTWGQAIEVPGTAALNQGPPNESFAAVYSVSCPSAGNCAAGGSYTDRSNHVQAFVASERNGAWGQAIEVPGTGGKHGLNHGPAAGVQSVSCGSAGNCVAGGYYTDSSQHLQAFAVSERDGTWGQAIEVPGTAALNVDGAAGAESVSCASAGNCAIGGSYTDRANHVQAFVASEKNGTWGSAIEVPGTAALNRDGAASVESVSCPSAGDCVAGGHYFDSSDRGQAFVASESHGTWRTATEVPGSGHLNTAGRAGVDSVSCASAGNCAAGGFYYNGGVREQAFVVSEKNGTWGSAIEVPGTAKLNQGASAQVDSVSCGSAGNCAAAGSYSLSQGPLHPQAFVVSETKGTWGRAIEVPGLAKLNQGEAAETESVSCPSAGRCAAGGYYGQTQTVAEAFVASES